MLAKYWSDQGRHHRTSYECALIVRHSGFLSRNLECTGSGHLDRRWRLKGGMVIFDVL